MAIVDIEKPDATAVVRWLPVAQGGRKSGPPTAPVYLATAVFRIGGESEVLPGWPANADHVSIMVQRITEMQVGVDFVKIGFLAPKIAQQFLHVGAEFLVMEGPKPVGDAVIREVFPHGP